MLDKNNVWKIMIAVGAAVAVGFGVYTDAIPLSFITSLFVTK